MIPIKSDEVKRWRVEIERAEKFKEEEFGTNEKLNYKGAGENISYYENGYSNRFLTNYNKENNGIYISLNIIYPIVKNVIPSLYYKNPYIVCIPKRKIDEDSSPYASSILNYYLRELAVKMVNQHVIFDAYVLGMGVCKIGYSTKIGIDMKDAEMKKRRENEKKRGLLEVLGLKKKVEEEEPQNIDSNEFIRSESPYVVWVNPFNFGIDPSATSIHNANYVYEKVRTTLDRVKGNPNYKNTEDLQGEELDTTFQQKIPPTEIEKFKPINLYEIHYKTDEGINILVLAENQGDYVALRHEKSIYDIDGFQYEVLNFNKHGHKLYVKSDVDIIKGMQDRVNTTFENIIDQVDRFTTKIGVDETACTVDGKKALRDGNLGSIVFFNKSPAECIKEISLTQVKGDLMVLIDKMIDIVSLETGITKAMLTGLTTAETATEAQIGQAGQNLRISDKADTVADFSNRQARKLWQVVRQFVDLQEVELITGEGSVDDVTNTPRYRWLEIDESMSRKLTQGEYDFQVEAGSTQKPDLPILRKQIENMVNILGGNGVLQAFQQQGYQIDLGEIMKKYLLLFPDVFTNVGKIIKPIQNQLPPPMGIPPQGSPTGGLGVIPQQIQSLPPTPADIMSEIGGEKGGNLPMA
jgi:hypothetical protein